MNPLRWLVAGALLAVLYFVVWPFLSMGRLAQVSQVERQVPSDAKPAAPIEAGARAQPQDEPTAEPPKDGAEKARLAVLPGGSETQLTIYNEEDLTLVRQTRRLTLKRGWNRLLFTWAKTRIDPTSLEISTRAPAVEIRQLSYPPGQPQTACWTIRSGAAQDAAVDIRYLAAGLSWRASYTITLATDGGSAALDAQVRVDNASGEDFENTEVRLVVGVVHLAETIAWLAERQFPYGSPRVPPPCPPVNVVTWKEEVCEKADGSDAATAANAISKEAFSEYQLYTIPGRDRIPDGWGKRLPSFQKQAVPVEHLFKYDEEQWTGQTVQFLAFANDAAHQLGDDPLPAGAVRVYRRAADGLSYLGAADLKYIPKGDTAELELGPSREVEVRPELMDVREENHLFGPGGDLAGWDEVRAWHVRCHNRGAVPSRLQVTRLMGQAWKLDQMGEGAAFEKLDLAHARFTLVVPARASTAFSYVQRTYHGTREQMK